MTESSLKVLFSGNIDISYSQFYIECEDPDDSLAPSDPFIDQANGLCGAAQEARLCFTARPSDATIRLEIHLCDKEPDIESGYEEIVEVSFSRGHEAVLLCEWAHEEEHPLEIPQGNYRVRYNIDGIDKDYDYEEDEEMYLKPVPGQRYLIQLWPAEPKHDEIVKQTTEHAAYWHNAHGK